MTDKEKIELDETTYGEFQKAVKDVLSVKPKEREVLEKRMPTRKELDQNGNWRRNKNFADLSI